MSVHSVVHDVTMGVAGAQGLEIAGVDVRRKGERPRAEVQPVQIGRQRPVRAVQHGETLTPTFNGGL
jgi:hypothetical protein